MPVRATNSKLSSLEEVQIEALVFSPGIRCSQTGSLVEAMPS